MGETRLQNKIGIIDFVKILQSIFSEDNLRFDIGLMGSNFGKLTNRISQSGTQNFESGLWSVSAMLLSTIEKNGPCLEKKDQDISCFLHPYTPMRFSLVSYTRKPDLLNLSVNKSAAGILGFVRIPKLRKRKA